jgi:hypothetical protein
MRKLLVGYASEQFFITNQKISTQAKLILKTL